MSEDWKQLKEPASYSKTDIYEYFGIPPHPEAELEKNIKAKRQFWGKRANGPSGRETAERIKNWIQQLSKILEDGEFPDEPIVHDESGQFRVLGRPTSPAELADQLEALLRIGDIEGILNLIQFALQEWPDTSEVILYVSLALSELLRDYSLNADSTALADRYTNEALQREPGNPLAWVARARFAYHAGQVGEVEALEQRAAVQGLTLPAEVYGMLASSAFKSGQTDRGIQYLIQQVQISGGDPAVRSMAVDIMLKLVVNPMLPIQNAKAAALYKEQVNVAAWLAEGVPESEAELVPYRLWAEQATGRMFLGDLPLKAFLGVLTGFIALPLYTRVFSRPGWRVLRDGPRNKNSAQQWRYLAGSESLREVHAKGREGFIWQSSVREPWPSPQEAQQLVQQQGLIHDNGKPVKKK